MNIWQVILKKLFAWWPGSKDWWEDKLPKVEDILPVPEPGPPEPEWTDDIDLNQLPGVKGIDTRGWPITSDLTAASPSRKKVRLDWNATQWASVNANVGSVWCAYEMDGKWSKAWRYDQIRHGQLSRDFPWNPPHPKRGERYDTVPVSATRALIWISTMARKPNETNGQERTKAAIINTG